MGSLLRGLTRYFICSKPAVLLQHAHVLWDTILTFLSCGMWVPIWPKGDCTHHVLPLAMPLTSDAVQFDGHFLLSRWVVRLSLWTFGARASP